MSNYPRWNLERFIFLLGVGIVSFVLLCLVRMALRTVTAHHMNAGGGVTQQALQKEFSIYNDTYFNGALPVDTQVIYSEPPDPGNIGETFCFLSPDNSAQNCRIYIAPLYNNAMPTAVETLIHESCHVATMGKDVDHGPVWQKCMLDVAEEGGFKGVW